MLQATRSLRLVRTNVRTFFGSSSTVQVSPAEIFPELPPVSPTSTLPVVTSSTLPNGLRLTSDTSHPSMTTIGVRVHAGTQFENAANAGVMHLWHCMAFRSTTSRSDLSIYRTIESLGGSFRSSHGRDFVDLALTTLPEHVETCVDLVYETLTRPQFALWDLEMMKRRAVDEMDIRSNVAMVQSALYEAAFYDTSALGRPLMDHESLADVTREDLIHVQETFVQPESLSVVGLGLHDHKTLETLVGSTFGSLSQTSVPHAPATVYVGGEVRLKSKSAPTTVIGLAFEGVPSSAKTLVSAAAVLQTHVERKLNQGHASRPFHVTSNAHMSTGLFSIVSEHLSSVSPSLVIQNVMDIIQNPISASEFQASQAVCANACADLDRYTRFQTAAAYPQGPSISDIQRVTHEDLVNVAKSVFSSCPSIASMGQVTHVPRLNEIQAKLRQ